MSASALADSLRRATHPLDAPPAGLPWNLHELDGLLSPGEPRPAAVLVGIVAHAETPTVLLTRRHEGLRHHAGQVSFVGGRIALTYLVSPRGLGIASFAAGVAAYEAAIVAAHWLGAYVHSKIFAAFLAG